MTGFTTDFEAKDAVIRLAAACSGRGWTPATAGNFSVRRDAGQVAITRSGTDKGALGAGDILILPLAEPPPRAASAEAPIHWALYRQHTDIGAVAHIHAPAATLLSMLTKGAIRLEGWELLKAIAGITTHETRIDVPVLPNTQDMEKLAEGLRPAPAVPALVLAGHGMYAWGGTAKDAFRHAEALEFMFQLELERRRFS